MKPPSEQSPTVGRIERRYQIFGWLFGTVMTVFGAATLLFLSIHFDWAIHPGNYITYSGRPFRIAYLIALGSAASFCGIVTLARLIKSSRRKSSKNK